MALFADGSVPTIETDLDDNDVKSLKQAFKKIQPAVR
jgi:hypothetical protein